jgi:hypothetical protein
MKKILQNIFLLFISLIITIIAAEFATRYYYPVPIGLRMLSLDGQPITEGGLLAPGLRYRLVSSEFDVITTIADEGYRVPEVKGNPDIIFIGDSFTFGVGLNDEETFIFKYCNALKLSCANLGMSGSGTISQINRLEKYLITQGWRPKEVNLFIFAMTGFLSHGNDLTDNLLESEKNRRAGESEREKKRLNKIVINEVNNEKLKSKVKKENSRLSKDIIQKVVESRNLIYRNSNLVRILYYFFGHRLRTIYVPTSDPERVNKALEITRQQLLHLDSLSKDYNFHYTIFLIHPMQDISRQTHEDTLKRIEQISPVPVYSTAHLFEYDTGKYYYFDDGHINTIGSTKIAEFLISLHLQ